MRSRQIMARASNKLSAVAVKGIDRKGYHMAAGFTSR
jgi:hypothetical protein